MSARMSTDLIVHCWKKKNSKYCLGHLSGDPLYFHKEKYCDISKIQVEFPKTTLGSVLRGFNDEVGLTSGQNSLVFIGEIMQKRESIVSPMTFCDSCDASQLVNSNLYE